MFKTSLMSLRHDRRHGWDAARPPWCLQAQLCAQFMLGRTLWILSSLWSQLPLQWSFLIWPFTSETISGPLCPPCSNKLTPILMLQEKERLAAMEKRYHSLTGGKSFPKSSSAMREVRALNLLMCLQQALTGTSSNRQWCVAADNLRSDCSTRSAIIKTNLKINGLWWSFLPMSRLIS